MSVVLPTYNRCGLLHQAISVLLNQEAAGLNYEVIVVDNNSTDATRRTVEFYASADRRLRYAFEQRQGVAYARNTGIQLARADVIAFCDDDVHVARDWVQNIHRAHMRFPDAGFVGGKVLPRWEQTPPKWLNATMPPLALQDRGEKPVVVSLQNPICLISASLGVRRRVFDCVGLFGPATQRVKAGIGSTEDYDWELKVWRNGGHGVYTPEIVCYCEVPPGRMQKAYHRRWHLGHGRFNAMARRAEFEGGRQFCDVPFFLYRQLIQSAANMPKQLLAGAAAEAFEREAQVWFSLGFISHRWRNYFIPKRKKSPQSTRASIHLTPVSRQLCHRDHEVEERDAA